VPGALAAGAALAWLLLLTFAATTRAALERAGALLLGGAAGALALHLGLRAPLAGESLVAAVGIAIALALLARGADVWPAPAAFLLGAGVGLLDSRPQLLVGLGLLGALAVPSGRILRRRPRAHRAFAVALGCATLATLGFSLVQTIAGF
jgi:hypothetical protein